MDATPTELMSFAQFLRNYDHAQTHHTPTPPPAEVTRQQELMRKAQDAVSRDLRRRWNERPDQVTMFPEL
jgi:hypothetical protein